MVLEFINLSKSRQCLQIHYSSNINPLWASTLKPSSYIDTSNMITCSGLLWRVSPPTFVLWLHHIHCTWTPSERGTGRVAPPRCPLKAEVATQTRGSLPSLRSTNMCSDRFNPPPLQKINSCGSQQTDVFTLTFVIWLTHLKQPNQTMVFTLTIFGLIE